jgi:hypothetical protein
MNEKIKEKSVLVTVILIAIILVVPYPVISNGKDITIDTQGSYFIISPTIDDGQVAGTIIDQWGAYIEHTQGETFDWWINTTPDMGNASGNTMYNGSISTSIEDLDYGDNFTINVTLHSSSENKNISYNISIVNLTKKEFLSDGSWTAPTYIDTINLLVIAGGGGGGGADGAGGGAGGLIYKEGYSVTPGDTYDITIGAGGAGGSSAGYDGENSTFGSIEAWGGGGGGQSLGAVGPGRPGGSGGGSFKTAGATGYYAHDDDPDTYGTDGERGEGGADKPKGGGAGSSGADGGQGLTFWGTEYCRGGWAANGGDNTGNGGNGKRYNGNGYPGGSGIVIVAYPETKIYNIAPTDNSTEDAQPTCSINTYHPTEATISFAHNITGEWHIQKTIHNASNGTYTWDFDEATALNQTYWWKVYIDDGTNNVTNIYSFKTGQIGLSGLLIENNTHIHRDDAQWWNISIADESGSFNWSIETAPDIGSAYGNDEGNGTKSCQLSNVEYSQDYTVYVNVTGSQRNETYTFTTQSGPEDKIHVVLSPQATADIKLNRTTWEPNLGWAGNITTGLQAFNLDNNGSVSVDVDIYIVNGTAWHPGTTPGHDQFNLSINTGAGWNLVYNTPEQFTSNLRYDESQDFGLQLYKPTSTSTADNQNITLVFEATVR